ncbi:MAG TPA: hypothetical protein VIW45_18135 [Vicinamibacterales bacterium]
MPDTPDVVFIASDVLSKARYILPRDDDALMNWQGLLSCEVDVLSRHQDVLSDDADVFSDDADVFSDDADVFSDDADVLSDDADVLSDDADVLSDDADVLSDDADVLSRDPDGGPARPSEVTESTLDVTGWAEGVADEPQIAAYDAVISTSRV